MVWGLQVWGAAIDSRDQGTEKLEQLFASTPCPTCGQTELVFPLKANTLHKRHCPKCKTVSYVFVSEGYDTIVFAEEELCPDCNGTGKCGTCKGTGKMTCPRCGGAGYYKDYHYYGCERCGGGGYVEYSSEIDKLRRGSGEVKCSECNGTGVCPGCMGYRRRRKVWRARDAMGA